MNWKTIGFMASLFLVILLVIHAFQRHREERVLATARASTSSVPLLIEGGTAKVVVTPAHGCAAVPDSLDVYGPAKTVSEMDGGALSSGASWQVLRQRAMSGDRVRLYKTVSLGAPAGGYVLLRGSCLLAQVPTWYGLALD